MASFTQGGPLTLPAQQCCGCGETGTLSRLTQVFSPPDAILPGVILLPRFETDEQHRTTGWSRDGSWGHPRALSLPLPFCPRCAPQATPTRGRDPFPSLGFRLLLALSLYGLGYFSLPPLAEHLGLGELPTPLLATLLALITAPIPLLRLRTPPPAPRRGLCPTLGRGGRTPGISGAAMHPAGLRPGPAPGERRVD